MTCIFGRVQFCCTCIHFRYDTSLVYCPTMEIWNVPLHPCRWPLAHGWHPILFSNFSKIRHNSPDCLCKQFLQYLWHSAKFSHTIKRPWDCASINLYRSVVYVSYCSHTIILHWAAMSLFSFFFLSVQLLPWKEEKISIGFFYLHRTQV